MVPAVAYRLLGEGGAAEGAAAGHVTPEEVGALDALVNACDRTGVPTRGRPER
ncbi:hypothetical protein [Actinorugispora endophytica]|uniref:hypothetical protein n=1 Tax=Actinorugispora endophytica TaxID=1605990 RepID=UPI001414E64D|nr:hypothetical protein [Actinorugispora endophytica]